MASLTSPSGCVSCASLADKIAELEEKISTLYQIQEAEKLMDTITFDLAQTDTTCARVPDATAPCPAAEAASSPESDVTAHCPAADGPPPVTVPDDFWIRLGAKPRALVSSTSSHHETWSLACARSRRGRHSSRETLHHNIQQENKYDGLLLHLPCCRVGPISHCHLRSLHRPCLGAPPTPGLAAPYRTLHQHRGGFLPPSLSIRLHPFHLHGHKFLYRPLPLQRRSLLEIMF